MEALGAMAMQVGLVAAYGGIVGLDRRNAFQMLLSQPLVTVALMGLAFGHLEQGVWLGSLLQLLWMSSVLFGANVPPNDTLASVVIAGIFFLFQPYSSAAEPALYSVAILLGLPVSALGRTMDIKLDQANLSLARRADAAVQDHRFGQIDFLPSIALTRAFLANGLLVGVALSVGLLILIYVEPQLSASILEALTATGVYIIPALGLAVALTMVKRRKAVALAVFFFILVTIFMAKVR